MSTLPRLIEIDYPKSQGLLDEIAAIYRSTNSKSELVKSAITSVEEYCRSYLQSGFGAELRRQAETLPPASRILDIGVGGGESSLYLASRGHTVTVVEPSPDLCRELFVVAKKFDLPLTIYIASAEALNRIQGEFDVAIFNASLHHCDDPILALKLVRVRLVSSGRLIVMNEPFLQFYRSKAWFYRRLQTHPVEMGHYGGNEHCYRYNDYTRLLRAAGFQKMVISAHALISNPKQRIEFTDQAAIP